MGALAPRRAGQPELETSAACRPSFGATESQQHRLSEIRARSSESIDSSNDAPATADFAVGDVAQNAFASSPSEKSAPASAAITKENPPTLSLIDSVLLHGVDSGSDSEG